MRYWKITCPSITTEQKEIVMANLADETIGSEEVENDFILYFTEDVVIERVEEVLKKHNIVLLKEIMEDTNWNSVWEAAFEPVVVDDFVAIRADFHPQFEQVAYQINITPKMSFGTGHHATTFSMLRQMRDIDFVNKTVLDFGTGTGILAILAKQLGAENVQGIDNDYWSIENAQENALRNQVEITLALSEEINTTGNYDIILANINRNVLLANKEKLYSATAVGGILLISGILTADLQDIRKAFEIVGFEYSTDTELNGWICAKFIRK